MADSLITQHRAVLQIPSKGLRNTRRFLQVCLRTFSENETPYSRMKNLLEHVMNSLKLNLHIFCNEATDSRNKSASVKRKIRKSENNMNIKKVLKLRMKKTKLPRTQCTCSCTAAVLILQQDPRCARPIASLEID